ncbi:MAG: hypothetical protein ACPG8W_22770 [Candidatus Promineifilaceae bacterium]
MNLSHFPLTPHDHQLAVLERLLTPFPAVRFMNWQQINLSKWDSRAPVREWDDLPQVNSNWRYEVGPWGAWAGVPLAELIRLANKLSVRPWMCIPNTASDQLIAQMVSFVIEHCDRRPIIEFSNEIWNPIFMQHHHSAESGADMAEKPFQCALRWQAQQTRKIAKAAQGSADVVVCGQFFNQWVIEQLLEGCGDVIDAIGVAPYLGRKQRAIEEVNGEWQMRDMQEMADEVSAEVATDITDRFRGFKRLADRHGLRLFAYEGGMHQIARNDHGRTAFEREKAALLTFNRSIHAGNNTRQLWIAWQENGGEIACPYSLSTVFEQQNTFFGHCELHQKEIRMLPKYLSARDVLGMHLTL